MLPNFALSPMLSIQRVTEGLGSLLLLVHWWIDGGLFSLMPTPNKFSLVDKCDVVGKCLVFKCTSNQHLASQWRIIEMAQNYLLGVSF